MSPGVVPNLINAGLLIVAIAAAAIAVIQTIEARKACEAAPVASVEGAEHEMQALEAAQRTASEAVRVADARVEANELTRTQVSQQTLTPTLGWGAPCVPTSNTSE